jgi:hypothetical protein
LACFSLFLTRSAKSGSGAYFAAAFFTEVTGAEPCASASSAFLRIGIFLRLLRDLQATGAGFSNCLKEAPDDAKPVLASSGTYVNQTISERLQVLRAEV